MAFKIIKGGLHQTESTPQPPKFKAPSKEQIHAQMRVGIRERFFRNHDAWIDKQRAMGKLP